MNRLKVTLTFEARIPYDKCWNIEFLLTSVHYAG
jgi:hypothetical protein